MTKVSSIERHTHEIQLPEWAIRGAVIVDPYLVNMDDLQNMEPGRVVRVKDMDAIRIIPAPFMDCDFIAGCISENP